MRNWLNILWRVLVTAAAALIGWFVAPHIFGEYSDTTNYWPHIGIAVVFMLVAWYFVIVRPSRK